ncbi:hypothetical protein BDZ90DRAFT_116126 [Jaminaea rosea]|uniref:BZIP domain-containing protein n=1 Tax=Jaminaea rosea TaxID=1569628 RepID=A0A316UWF2_9BASI|nr:hypothetical protein BDZ90DRAFT_116126 [Jaminaea rosea]PWN29626.1 hypothetical protein BDZ90DRAFT_116126 [Jaminaea rosea]
MAAATDTMSMALSPGLDAIKASPLSRSAESLQLNDYLDLPSSPSLASAHPAPSPLARMAVANATNPRPSSSASTSKPVATTSAAADCAVAVPSTPPPPGSAPEVVFRYYLKLELKKMGSPADDATIDRHVAQHYGTFLKAMDTGKATTPASIAAKPAPAPTPFVKDELRYTSPVSEAVTSSPIAPVTALASTSPQPQPQPFKVPAAFDDIAAPPAAPVFENIDPQYVSFRGSIPLAEAQQADEEAGDAMSEDGHQAAEDGGASFEQQEEDSKDSLAPLISSLRFGGSDRANSTASSSRGSEEPGFGNAGVPPSIRDSAAANLKPTAEEYRALSSKEKRQLRNKISARNFRERRKEYIGHLEGEISDRDAIISSLRSQMSQLSLQNKKLEEEVKTLQAKQLSQSDVAKILEALQNVAVPANADHSQQASTSSAWGLRSSAANDVTLSNNWTGGYTPSSRPSTPSSPRPTMARRASPSLLPQHNPRKDMPATAASAAAGNKGASWRGGPTVAASA